MEPEGSLPYLQAPATCPYPELTIQSLHPNPTSRRSILTLSSHLRLGLPSGLFPSGFPTNTLCTPLSSPIRATQPAHLILLDFTTRTILSKEYGSFSSSLCNFKVYIPIQELGPRLQVLVFFFYLRIIFLRDESFKKILPHSISTAVYSYWFCSFLRVSLNAELRPYLLAVQKKNPLIHVRGTLLYRAIGSVYFVTPRLMTAS
jgi:hypothetical protein